MTGIGGVDGRADDLLAELQARGVAVSLDGGRVRWRAPAGAMTVELVRRVKALEGPLADALRDVAAGEGRPAGRRGPRDGAHAGGGRGW